MSTLIQKVSTPAVRLLLALVMLSVLFIPASKPAEAWSLPTIDIMSVDANDTVTIRPVAWPANEIFTVRMGYYGGFGIGGTVVGTISSGPGGVLANQEFAIPAHLKSEYMIAVRTESTTGYYFSYNWFYNIDSGPQPLGYVPYAGAVAPVVLLPTASPPGVFPTALPPMVNPYYNQWGIPTFIIAAVARDSSVTILTNNIPPNMEFIVRMNEYGTLGYGGVVVGTIPAGPGGSFEATFPIPAYYAGRYQIAIRADSPQGYYAYNWFFNNSTY